MKDFFEILGYSIVFIIMIVGGFVLFASIYALVLVLIFYFGYVMSYVFGYFVPIVKTLQYRNFNYHEIIAFFVTIFMMISIKMQKTIENKKEK
jgi:hypothetical protein